MLPLKERSLARHILAGAERFGDRPFMTFADTTYSFSQLAEQALSVSRALGDLGIQPSSRILLYLSNRHELIVTWFASALAGCIVVPINRSFKGDLLEYAIQDCRPDVIVTDDPSLSTLRSLPAEALSSVQWFAVVGSDETGVATRLKNRPVHQFDDFYSYSPVGPERLTSFDAIDHIMYTSGTTGPAKGVPIANAQAIKTALAFVRVVALTASDVLFSPLPLFHGMATRMGVLPCLVMGTHLVRGERFSLSGFWDEVRASNATVAHTIFSIPSLLMTVPESSLDKVHNLRAMYNAPFNPEFEERFNVQVLEAFAMTETGATLLQDYPPKVRGSCGRPDPEWEVELLNDERLPVVAGEVGEIVVRPRLPHIMTAGYLNKPDETLSAMADLWFHTGDLARRDEDDWFFYEGRIKERIRRRGENVSPWDIELASLAHPLVAEAVAVGHPAKHGEDDIRLVVVAKESAGQFSVGQLSLWLESRLPTSLVPRYIELVPNLPKTPTQKVQRGVLVERGLGPDAWDREAQ